MWDDLVCVIRFRAWFISFFYVILFNAFTDSFMCFLQVRIRKVISDKLMLHCVMPSLEFNGWSCCFLLLLDADKVLGKNEGICSICVLVLMCLWLNILYFLFQDWSCNESFCVYGNWNCWARVLVNGEVNNHGLNVIALKVFVKMLIRKFWLH